MKRFLYGLAGLFSFCIVGLIALIAFALLMPKEVYRDRIEKSASDALGREVSLNGAVKLGFFPGITAEIEDMVIANPEGFSSTPFVSARALSASIAWAPLIQRQIQVTEIALIEPDIALERLPDGRPNWEIASTQTLPAHSDEAHSETQIKTLIYKIRLTNGSVTYQDAHTGQNFAVGALNIDARLNPDSQALILKGDGLFNEDRLKIDLDIASLQALYEAESSAIDLRLETDFGNLNFQGDGQLAQRVFINGDFDIKAQNLAALAVLSGIDAEAFPLPLEAFTGLEASGVLTLQDVTHKIDFSRLTLLSDRSVISYEGAVNLSERPSLDGYLTLSVPKLTPSLMPTVLSEPQKGILNGSEINLTSQMRGPIDQIDLKNASLSLVAPQFSTDFAGIVRLRQTPELEGKASYKSASIDSLFALMDYKPSLTAQAMTNEIAIDFSSILNGPVTRLKADAIELALQSPYFKAGYQGQFIMTTSPQFDGALRFQSNRFDTLLSALDIQTGLAKPLETAELNTKVKGTPQVLTMTALTMSANDLLASGDLTLDQQGKTPLLSGKIALGEIDLDAYIPVNDPETSTSWDDIITMIENTAGFNLDLSLTAPEIILDARSYKNADLDIKLIDGVFNTNVRQVEAYGGQASGQVSINTNAQTPTASVQINAQNMLLQSLVSHLNMRDFISGTGGLDINLRTQGRTNADLFGNLNGQIETKTIDGALNGIDLSQIIQSVSNWRSGLALGNLTTGISPKAQTQFNGLLTDMDIRQGIAKVKTLEMSSPVAGFKGGGTIDLARQALNLNLTLRSDKTGSGNLKDLQINNHVLGVTMAGPWSAPTILPERTFLRNVIASEASGLIEDLIGTQTPNSNDTVSDVTNILGELLASQSQPEDDESGQDTQKTPAKEEIRDTALDIMGGFIRRQIEEEEEEDRKQEAEKDD